MTIPQVSGYGNYSYPYQTYSPPQFNIGNNNGYSTPTFRGAESRPPRHATTFKSGYGRIIC